MSSAAASVAIAAALAARDGGADDIAGVIAAAAAAAYAAGLEAGTKRVGDNVNGEPAKVRGVVFFLVRSIFLSLLFLVSFFFHTHTYTPQPPTHPHPSHPRTLLSLIPNPFHSHFPPISPTPNTEKWSGRRSCCRQRRCRQRDASAGQCAGQQSLGA